MRSPTAATAVSTPPSPRGKQTPALPPSSLSPPKATPKATSKAASPKAKATASPKTKALSVPVPSPKAPKAAPVSPRSALAKALAPKAKPSGRMLKKFHILVTDENAFVGCQHVNARGPSLATPIPKVGSWKFPTFRIQKHKDVMTWFTGATKTMSARQSVFRPWVVWWCSMLISASKECQHTASAGL